MATDSKGILDPDQGPTNLPIKDVFGGGGWGWSNRYFGTNARPHRRFSKMETNKGKKRKAKNMPVLLCIQATHSYQSIIGRISPTSDPGGLG